MRRAAAVSALVLAAALLLWVARGPQRTVYVGGPVVTLDAENRVVEALGVEADRIAVVGSRAEVEAWAGGAARVVDLEGAALLPGFIDAHGHFPGAGIYAITADLNSPPIGDVRNLDGLIAALRALADEKDAGQWVVGMSYDDTLLAERRHPTRQDLDRVSTRHPVAAIHISGHLATTNSAGLEALGFDADSPDPAGGRIRRDARGEPDGVLEETAMEGLMRRVLQPSTLDALRIAREGTRRYLAAGVTTAQVGYATPEQINGLILMWRVGLLPLRVVFFPGGEVADALLAGELELSSPDPEWLRIGAIKLVADGSIQGYTGYLSEPYHVPPGDDPGFRGYPRIARGELLERVARYHAAGHQLAIHGNGDASIDDILDALEAAHRKRPDPDARPIVIHAQMTRDDQLDRMAALGVIPSFFSLHTYYWGDRHRDIFMGPARASRMSPARSAQQKNVRFTIHCDAPVVPMTPLRLVWAAVNRRSTSGAVIGPAERIDVPSALRATTIDAAYQHFEESLKGSLEAGKLADLVVLSESPLAVEPERIADIRVLETIVGGESAYRATER